MNRLSLNRNLTCITKSIIVGFSCFIFSNVFAVPLNYTFKNEPKSHIQIVKVNIVPSTVTEKIVSVKTMHGKTTTRKIPVAQMDQSAKGEKKAKAYLLRVRQSLLDLFSKDKKLKKISGKALLKIQVQKDGSHDILFVGGGAKDQKFSSQVEKNLYSLGKLSQIPDDLMIEELQLKIHIQSGKKK